MAETGTEIVASRSQQGLTAEQGVFVSALMRGASAEEAAREAGRPGDEMALMLDSAVQATIESQSRAILISSIPTVLVEITRLARNATAADRARIEACKATLAMAGIVAPVRERARSKSANLADMDVDALRALVDQIQGELGARATPVHAPNVQETSPKRAALLE